MSDLEVTVDGLKNQIRSAGLIPICEAEAQAEE